MDLIKIGKFIASCRKDKKMTQEELAEKLFITERAVSKWERGLSLPDADKMLDLCNILNINVNELLNGERIDMKDYNKKTEELLVEMARQEELKNKKLMMSMWTILITSSIFYIAIMLLAVNILKKGVLLGAIICFSTTLFVISSFIALKFEVDAGYYECKKCGHRFVPSFIQALNAPHMSTTRYIKCPKCGKKTWTKKVMSKE